MIEKENVDIEQLRAFALLLQPFQLDEKGDRVRISRNFFDEYGKIIAGPCGCSHLVPDHRKAKVENSHAFLSLTTALYYTPWIDCSITELTHIVESGFHTGYRFNTLRDRLGKGSELSDAFSELFSNPKIKNLVETHFPG